MGSIKTEKMRENKSVNFYLLNDVEHLFRHDDFGSRTKIFENSTELRISESCVNGAIVNFHFAIHLIECFHSLNGGEIGFYEDDAVRFSISPEFHEVHHWPESQ